MFARVSMEMGSCSLLWLLHFPHPSHTVSKIMIFLLSSISHHQKPSGGYNEVSKPKKTGTVCEVAMRRCGAGDELCPSGRRVLVRMQGKITSSHRFLKSTSMVRSTCRSFKGPWIRCSHPHCAAHKDPVTFSFYRPLHRTHT